MVIMLSSNKLNSQRGGTTQELQKEPKNVTSFGNVNLERVTFAPKEALLRFKERHALNIMSSDKT